MQGLRPFLLVGFGGFLGSAGRYAVREGLATLEKVDIRFYRSGLESE